MKFPVDILLYKVYNFHIAYTSTQKKIAHRKKTDRYILQLKNENDTCVTGGTQKNTPTAMVPAKELIDR